MSIRIVSSVTGLLAALKTAVAGDTIALAPGTYGGFTIYHANFSGSGVTITSANSSDPAVLTSFNIDNSSGLVLSDLQLDTVGSGSPIPFRVNGSRNVTLTGLTVHGTVENAATISGLLIRSSSYVTVTNSTFYDLRNGLENVESTHVTISNNSFHNMDSDGIDNAGSSGLLISNNRFEDFTPVTGAHPDAIQFWTNTGAPISNDITVTANQMNRGTGSPYQGIFVQSGSYFNGGGGNISNVTVSDNTITGLMYRGISFQDVDGGFITDNKVIAYSDMPSFITVQFSKSITLTDNRSMLYSLQGNTGSSLSGDTVDSVLAVPTQTSVQAATSGGGSSATTFSSAIATVTTSTQSGSSLLTTATVLTSSTKTLVTSQF